VWLANLKETGDSLHTTAMCRHAHTLGGYTLSTAFVKDLR